jgi:ABC-type Fe3+/spermidine/putrescine transport system ATPase subunit
MSAIIALEQVTLRRGGAVVLDRVDLSVSPGEIVAVAGPSGSGKTTLLRVLLGFEVPEVGTVTLRGRAATALGRLLVPPEERNLAVVFQDLALWPHLTVRGNLAFGLDARGVPRRTRDERIAEMLIAVGLEGRRDRYPGELSGGERQRVAIARALVLEPDAVLLDEPLSNLDVALKLDLLDLFDRLLRSRRVAVVSVTHDPIEAERLGDRIAVLEGGRIAQTGTASELANSPASEFVQRFSAKFEKTCPR